MPILQIDIEARFAKFQDTLDQVFKSTSKSAAGIQSAFAGVKKALGVVGVGLSVAAIIDFFDKAREAAVEFETSTKKLDAVFKNIGDAAGVSKREIEGFAEELKGSTQFGGEDLRNASSEILKFGKIHGDTFREALKVSADLAAFMGTNVAEAAAQVSKALADPGTATKLLKQAGVVLSEQQKDELQHMIAIGDSAGAQILILKKLQDAYAGVAQEMNTGLIRATTGLTKSWHAMLEEIGKTKAASDQGFFGFVTERIHAATSALKEYNQEQEKERHALNGPQSGRIRPAGETQQSRIDEINALLAKSPGKSPAKAAEEADAAYARDKINRQIDIALLSTHLATKKDILEKAAKELDRYYSDSLISEAAFYEGRKALVQRGLDDELRSINEGIKQQEYILSHGASKEELSGAQVELVKLSERRKTAQRAASDEFQALTFSDTKSAREFNKELASLAETTLTIQQNTAAAAAIKAFDPNNDQRRRLIAETNSQDAQRASAARAAIEQLDLQGKLLVSKAALTDEERRFSQIIDEVSIAQQRIAVDAASGAITEIDALNRLSAVNKSRIADLTVIAERYEAIARVSGDPADVIKAQRLRLEIHRLASETDLFARKFNDAFAGSLANTLTDLASGTVSLKDAFHSLTNSILRDINSILAKDFAQKLFGIGGSGSGAGGFFSKIFSGGSIFGGGGGIGIGGVFGGDFDGTSFATGTDYVPRTGLALIHKGERIIPAGENTDSRRPNITQNFNFAAPTERGTQAQLAAVAASAIQRATSRNL